MDIDAQIKYLRVAQTELYDSGRYRQSASTAREIAKLAMAFNDKRGLVHARYWEGESLERAGDLDAALSPLLEAANIRSPDVDPADTVGAMLVAIGVAQQRKPLEYVLGLLSQTRRFLEELGKDQRWGDSVLYREAQIAFARGLFSTSLTKHIEAWNRRSGSYPSYTIGTHLVGLCEASFFLRDKAALGRWTTAFSRQPLTVEEDKIHQLAARVFAVRARVDDGSGLELSRSLLDRALGSDLRPGEGARCGLRVLLSCGAFDEAERWWGRYCEKKKSLDYFDRLLMCDWQLAFARTMLRLQPQDDEWDTDFAVPLPPFSSRERLLAHLDQAERCLQDLHAWALSEDKRLETDYYTRTVRVRLERLYTLRAPLGEV